MVVLGQVCKGNNIAGVVGGSVLIGHPHLNAVDTDTAEDIGQLLHVCIVLIAEIMCKEEVAVLIVLVCRKFITGQLHTALAADGLTAGFLLRDDGLHLQFSKLQIGTHTKQGGSTAHQLGVGGQGNVTCLKEFDNLVILSFVMELHILVVKGKSSL